MNKKYTIFGNPVEHSKSPQIYNKGFEFLNIDANYTKTKLENGEMLKKEFLAGTFYGANITVPHKEIAFQQADEVIGLAKEIKAVNTYINRNGKIIGYNTDSSGFIKSIEEFENIKNILIMGAGGVAKAIAIALNNEKYNVTVLNRSENKLNFFENIGCKTFVWDNFKSDKYDLVINATSAGLDGISFPVGNNLIEEIIDNSSICYDCVYGQLTPFLELAKNKGKIIKDGEDMLLYQAVIAFELFTGKKPSLELIEEMRIKLRNS